MSVHRIARCFQSAAHSLDEVLQPPGYVFPAVLLASRGPAVVVPKVCLSRGPFVWGTEVGRPATSLVDCALLADDTDDAFDADLSKWNE